MGSRRVWAAYAFVAPALLFFLVFFVFPVAFAVYVSFHEWDMLAPLGDMTYVGLRQYAALWRDPLFHLTFRNTFLYAAGMVAATPPLALGAAMLLNARLRFQWLWRTAFFVPVITSAVAASLVWNYIFDPNYGPLNDLLMALHLPPQRWLADPRQALGCIVAVSVWQSLGYYAVIYLAGVQGIPRELREAAAIDGAGPWQQFRYITLPLLRPTTLFVVVMLTINALQVFTPIFVMTGGGPGDATNVVVLYLYQTAFQFSRIGTASAMAMVLFGVVLAVTLVQVRLLRRGVLSW